MGLAAAEAVPAPTDVNSYLEQLQATLEHAAQRANQPGAAGSSVVGVRGAKEEPLSKQLYWKGKEGPVPVSAEEIRVFRAAIEEARAGLKTDAVAALEKFQQTYPRSALNPDARETVRLLSLKSPSAAAPAAPAP